MPRAISSKSLKKKCDIEFSKLIRSVGQCQRCSKSSGIQLQCAHIYSRKYTSIRFDPFNAVCLCAGCHFWAHQNPLEFIEFIQNSFEGRLEYLREARKLLIKRKPKEWQELLLALKEVNLKALMVLKLEV